MTRCPSSYVLILFALCMATSAEAKKSTIRRQPQVAKTKLAKKLHAMFKGPAHKVPAPALSKAELPPTQTDAVAPPGAPAPAGRGPSRIDFDDRLIQGQTNKSGAVYLYDRRELKLPRIYQLPASFRGRMESEISDG